MNGKNEIRFKNLEINTRIKLPFESFLEKKIFIDKQKSAIHTLVISNGALTFSILFERGKDIGEIFLEKEKFSWERDSDYLLHPDNVNLYDKGGWEKGFYAAVAALGPEVFGTPDEVRTVHGTGSYSQTALDSIHVTWDNEQICIDGMVPIKGYNAKTIYQKNIRIIVKYNASIIVREDSTKNLTGERQPLDDGYHIQLAGNFISDGGKYVLPVARDNMLLRDSAPMENDPLEIYKFDSVLYPIRCYQYVPERVTGLEKNAMFADYSHWIKEKITAEMIVNLKKDAAAFVIRPLESFPRSLIAKKSNMEPMYALEPCKTRPNSIRQKAIDGELFYLEPYGRAESWILLGVTKDTASILSMESLIQAAAR